MWSSTQIGLLYTARTYNTFTLPVLSYLGQLTDPPPEVYQSELQCLEKLSHGPGTYCTAMDLWYLDRAFAFPVAFRSVRYITWASQLRVAFSETYLAHDPWNVMVRSKALTTIMIDSDRLVERAEWQDWYKSSFTFLLNSSLQDAIAINVSPLVIYRKLLANHQQGHTSTAKASAKVISTADEVVGTLIDTSV